MKRNFIFTSCFSRSHFLLAMKNFETPRRNGCSYNKGSLGRDMPSIGMQVGLLLALTWQAASPLLELSSSTLSSWCGLCRWPDWAPHWLGARALAPWACSWSLQGHKPISATSSTSGSSKRYLFCWWLACSNTLACPWWSLEGSLKATQNRPISNQKVLVNLAACRHSCLENNRPSTYCCSCWASVQDRLWIHNAVGRWGYQAKEEEQINVALFVAWK